MTPASAFVCLALVFCVAAAAVAADGPADIGSRLQLMVSPALIESMKGVSLKLHPPVPREVVFTLDAPYEGGAGRIHWVQNRRGEEVPVPPGGVRGFVAPIVMRAADPFLGV